MRVDDGIVGMRRGGFCCGEDGVGGDFWGGGEFAVGEDRGGGLCPGGRIGEEGCVLGGG